jgi:hypothetical protein
MKKENFKLSGTALAMAAATLATGCASWGGSDSGNTTAENTTDLVHCYDVNVCKGHNDCKTANNACTGHASCKGTGFVAMPSKSCADVGGKQKDKWVGSISKSKLVHCEDVNVCKGHNDCKTATNACAGHASCKGTGFVLTPEKACNDIGGKVS